MDTLKVLVADKEISLPYGTRVGECFKNNNVIAAKINNKIYSLDKELKYNAQIKPVTLGSKEASVIYRRSLCYLLAMAVSTLSKKNGENNKRLVIGHSIDNAYYYTLGDNEQDANDRVNVKKQHITEQQVNAIENEMKTLCSKNLPISTVFMAYDDAKKILDNGRPQLLDFRCPPRVRMCVTRLNNPKEELASKKEAVDTPQLNCSDNLLFADIYTGPLVSNTGILKSFALTKYGDGFLLRFPVSADFQKVQKSLSNTNNIDNIDNIASAVQVTEFRDQPKLFETYCLYKNWGQKIGVTNVAELNNIIVHGKVTDFIDITEIFQQRCIADIALQITQKKSVRVVLIAGPSSSGKTTTSKKLALELQALGLTPKVISLDCYYAGHDRTPRDENGNLDFECLEALDIKLLNENLVDLFRGEEVNIPTYDFATGKQYFLSDNKMSLDKNDILIMEGIHGLNPKLTPLIADNLKFKIYLSALTQLNLDDHNRISTSDNRLIRRIVRDYQFRGKSASGTIKMWPSVRRGEELHIFPFQNNADAILNTALDYELCVLKVYAEPLLKCVKPAENEYSVACNLLDFLENFATIDSSAVPERSIIREFIGGSAFKY